MKTVVSLLRSGFGNQLFQYAAARSLADKTGAKLVLDTSYFKTDSAYKRTFALDRLRIRYDAVRDAKFVPKILARHVRRAVAEKYGLQFPNFACEKQPYSHQPVADFAGHVALDGYWQSEKYFAENADAVFGDLQFANGAAQYPECGEVLRLVESAAQTVFIHVRSFGEMPGKQAFSNALPEIYYNNAIRHLQSELGEFKMLVFSDNTDWAKTKITVPAGVETLFVLPSGHGADYDQYRDFHLMAKCRHGVCANSSFSWWANWLGEHRCLRNGIPTLRIRPATGGGNKDKWPEKWSVIM